MPGIPLEWGKGARGSGEGTGRGSEWLRIPQMEKMDPVGPREGG